MKIAMHKFCNSQSVYENILYPVQISFNLKEASQNLQYLN